MQGLNESTDFVKFLYTQNKAVRKAPHNKVIKSGWVEKRSASQVHAGNLETSAARTGRYLKFTLTSASSREIGQLLWNLLVFTWRQLVLGNGSTDQPSLFFRRLNTLINNLNLLGTPR